MHVRDSSFHTTFWRMPLTDLCMYTAAFSLIVVCSTNGTEDGVQNEIGAMQQNLVALQFRKSRAAKTAARAVRPGPRIFFEICHFSPDFDRIQRKQRPLFNSHWDLFLLIYMKTIVPQRW